MATIILNIFGLFLIIISILIINKDLNQEDKYIDINQIEENVKEYYKLTEELVENFDHLIDNKMVSISNQIEDMDNKIEKDNNIKSTNNLIFTENNKKTIDNTNSDTNKIMELKEIGLTKEEIARKLNKGIREIDIIIRMQKNNKK